MLGLFLFALSSVGTGAFHPAGRMVATIRGSVVSDGKERTAEAIFFLFGQTGLFLGPLDAGIVLDWGNLLLLALKVLLIIPV